MALRNSMVRAGFRTNAPFGDVFSDILGFAKEANRPFRLLTARRAAAEERERNTELAANRAEKLEALDWASRLEKFQVCAPFNSYSFRLILIS
jgi:hypothetical protein